MKNKTIDLGNGVKVTLAPADGWAILKRQAISERLKAFADGSETMDNYLWYYAICATQVTSVKKMDWQPPEAWYSTEELQANFEAWMKAIPAPHTENTGKWLDAVTELNAPAVAKELAPGGAPEPGSPKAKSTSSDG